MLVHQLIRRSGVRLFRPAGSGRAFTAGVPWHASIGAAVADEDSATSGGDLAVESLPQLESVLSPAAWAQSSASASTSATTLASTSTASTSAPTSVLSPQPLTGTATHASESTVAHDATALDAAGALDPAVLDPNVLATSLSESGVDLSTTDMWWNTTAVMEGINWLHVTADLPWWACIGGITFGLRTLMLPVAINTMRNGVRLAHAQPEFAKLREQMMANPPSTPEEQQKFKTRQHRIMAKHQCNPFGALMMPLIQMPVFMTMFFALKQMGDYYPSMATGGTLWFHDLTVADSTYALPIVSAATFLVIIEIGADTGGAQQQQGMMKNFMRGLAVMMVPMTASFAQAVFVYWTTSNFFSLGQTAILKIPGVKSMLDIPNPPPPPPGADGASSNPFSAAIDLAKKKAGAASERDDAPPPPPPPPQTFQSNPAEKKRTAKAPRRKKAKRNSRKR